MKNLVITDVEFGENAGGRYTDFFIEYNGTEYWAKWWADDEITWHDNETGYEGEAPDDDDFWDNYDDFKLAIREAQDEYQDELNDAETREEKRVAELDNTILDLQNEVARLQNLLDNNNIQYK